MRFSAYPHYKPSGIEWVGNVPSHWEVLQVRLRYSIQLGKMLQPEAKDQNDREVPYLKAINVQWGQVQFDDLPTMWACEADIEKYSVFDGDLLVCEGGEVGRAAIINQTVSGTIIQNALHRIRGREDQLRFLMYALRHAASQGWFDILCNKATIAHFTSEKLKALRIALPPVQEQMDIITLLDHETCRIDRLIAKKRELIEKLKEKRTALISRTVTHGLPPDAARAAGLDPDPQVKLSGFEWLGEIPVHWRVTRLKFICSQITDGEHISPSLEDQGIPLLSAKDIRERRILIDVEKFVAPSDALRFWRRCRPTKGDVLIVSRGATIGRVGFVEDEAQFCLMGSVILCRPAPNSVTSAFLYFCMNSNRAQRCLLLSSASSAQQAIYIVDVADLTLPIPPLNEQEAITSYLSSETARLDRLIEKVTRAISKLQEYRTALITAAVTGKIDVRGLSARERNHADEPILNQNELQKPCPARSGY